MGRAAAVIGVLEVLELERGFVAVLLPSSRAVGVTSGEKLKQALTRTGDVGRMHANVCYEVATYISKGESP